MKLDLVEINKLSPPGLWDLGVLSAFISTLHTVIAAGIGGRGSVLFYARMVVQQSNQLRKKTRENFNIRIKAWVMQCPDRIAWVRRIIGETAIRRWRKNRLVDYALSKYFGDWRAKFPDGFGSRHQKQIRKPECQHKLRTYNWKLFALTKIINVERFLYERIIKANQTEEMQAAYYKLWGVDILATEYLYQGIKRTYPREKRSFKPVEFTPYELVPKAATGTPEDKEDKEDKEEGGTAITIPPKPLRILAHAPPKNVVPTTSHEPPNTN